VEALQRQLHTLKGGARMAGVVEIGDLGHAIESLLTAVVDDQLAPSPAMFDLLQKAQDRLVGLLEDLKAGRPLAPASDLLAEVEAMLGRGPAPQPASEASEPAPAESPEPDAAATEEVIPALDAEAVAEAEDEPTEIIEADPSQLAEPPPEGGGEEEAEPRTVSETPAVSAADADEQQEPAPQAAPPVPETEAPPAADNVVTLKPVSEAPPVPEPASEMPTVVAEAESPEPRQAARLAPQEQVRVRAELLDNLVNFAGEVSIYRSRLEQQTNAFRYNLRELDETVSRLRQQLRAFEIETEAQIQYRQEESLSRDYDEFDPLEFDRFTHMQQLSRGMMESLADLDSLRAILANLTQESETLLLQQSRVNTEL